MKPAASRQRNPLGLFPDKPTPRLYDRVVGVLRVRHDSRRTEEAYVHWIRRFIAFNKQRITISSAGRSPGLVLWELVYWCRLARSMAGLGVATGDTRGGRGR